MDQVHVVRHKVLVEGLSVRAVARQLRISRNTVKRYVEGAVPGERAPAPPPVRPAYDRARARLAAILDDSPRWTGGKQRLTAVRLHDMLVGEGHQVGETLVKEHFREWRRRRQEVFVPLVYAAGDLAEVDFFEVLVDVAGERRKAHLFLMRLMHSGRDFAWIYPRQDQVCFLDGHVRAFAHFGAVPLRIAYDNLKAAVRKMLAGSERELAPRFAALAAHYVFEPCFARPRTGHDKGGVESRGKGIRWQHLVPIPAGPDLASISAALLARLDAQAGEGDVLARFELERGHMLPVPERPFRAALVRLAATSRRALAKVEGAVYSFPCEWAGRDVTAYVGVDTVELELPDRSRVVHPRQPFGGRSVDYRHYLSELARKPQAVRQVAHVLIEQLGEPYDAVWRRLVDASGPREAARHFARILGDVVRDGLDLVAGRLRRALDQDLPLSLALAPRAPARPKLDAGDLPAGLAAVEVQTGRAADYDALVGGES
jgi:transposase